MRTVLLAIFIFLSCVICTTAQKKYLAKIQILEGKWSKGILMKVDSNGIYLQPKKMGWSRKKLNANFRKAKFFDFREI